MERVVVLSYGPRSFNFGWRDGILRAEFDLLFAGAVRSATGLQELSDFELLADEGRHGQGSSRVTPLDIFQGSAQRAKIIPGGASIRGGRQAALVRTAMPSRDTGTSLACSPPEQGQQLGRGAYAKMGGSQLQFVRMLDAEGGVSHVAGGRDRQVEMEEVHNHRSLSDAWMVLEGRVFNVTPYLEYHPGGPSELMRGAGSDATALFREVHSWVSVSMLDRLQVGVLQAATIRPGARLDLALSPTEWRSFRLQSLQQKTPDTFLFKFGFNESQRSGLRPGQHLKVRALLPTGHGSVEVHRPYTPVSDPTGHGYVQLLVKVYPHGKMGQALAVLCPDGAGSNGSIEMQGPFGDLVYTGNGWFEIGTGADTPPRREVASHVVMIAAGSGVAPMLQLLRVISAEWKSAGGPQGPRVSLVCCNRSEEDIALREGLEHMANSFLQHFRLALVLSKPTRDSASWRGGDLRAAGSNNVLHMEGRIDDNLLRVVLSGDSTAEGRRGQLFLSCGPDGFNMAAVGSLQRLDVPTNRVYVF